MADQAKKNAIAAKKKRLQMQDIAQMAGVSISTVSRALNNSPLVNDETREKVRALAEKLNYNIDIGAQTLRLGNNKTIAVVIPLDDKSPQYVSDPFFLTMLGYIADELTRLGYYMLVSRVSVNTLNQVLEPYYNGRAAGIIVIGQWNHHDQLNQIEEDLPIVVWGAMLPNQRYVTVGSDNIQGGYLATEHLIQKRGCTRIAFLGNKTLPEVHQRYQGYLQAHHRYGLAVEESLCIPVPFAANTVESDLAALIQGPLQLDGIFACSDLIAMSAIRSLQNAGLEVPGNIPVVGYDDISMAAYYRPAITTVHQSIAQGAKALVASIFALLRGEDAPSTQLGVHLLLRESA